MFGLFKKHQSAVPGAQPNPQHRNFARLFIPDSLKRHRGGFLAAMADSGATQTLHEAWRKFGAGMLPTELLLAPAGLSASAFQHQNHLCIVVVFPAPKAPGESYFGLIVAGPSENWSPEVRGKVPVRFFLLERSTANTPVIMEWQPSEMEAEEAVFKNLGAGPAPQNPPDFIEAILSRFYGLQTKS